MFLVKLLLGGLLHRMLFWELVRVFALSLTGLTGLFLIAGLIQQASQLGLAPGQVLQVIPLLVPSILPYTVPATTLFASCVVYGRLSADNEAVAMKAAGVNLFTVLRPAVTLGLLTAGGTAAISHTLIPRSQQMLQEQLLSDPEEVLYNLLRRELSIRSPGSPFVMYVRDVQGDRLIDVVLKRRARVIGIGASSYYGYDFVARAKTAKLVVEPDPADPDKRVLAIDPDQWVVEDGKTRVISRDTKKIYIDLPEMFSPDQVQRRSQSVIWSDLPVRVADYAVKRDEKLAVAEDRKQRVLTKTDPLERQKLQADQMHHEAQAKDLGRLMRNFEYEYHMRPALAVGCLCFAVIGCPVGLWANRADYLSTFVTCFLPTVFAYYPLMLAGGGLARDGKVPMAVGVWAANAVAGLAAVALIVKLIKR